MANWTGNQTDHVDEMINGVIFFCVFYINTFF